MWFGPFGDTILFAFSMVDALGIALKKNEFIIIYSLVEITGLPFKSLKSKPDMVPDLLKKKPMGYGLSSI